MGTIKEYTGAVQMYGSWHWFSKSWCLSPGKGSVKGGVLSERTDPPNLALTTEFVIPGKYGQKIKRENRNPEKPPANLTAMGTCEDVTHSS